MNWTTYDQYVVTRRRTFPGYPYPRQIDRICLKWISSVASIRNYYSLTNFHFVGLCWCTAICKSQTRWMIVIFRFLYKHCLYHFFFSMYTCKSRQGSILTCCKDQYQMSSCSCYHTHIKTVSQACGDCQISSHSSFSVFYDLDYSWPIAIHKHSFLLNFLKSFFNSAINLKYVELYTFIFALF